MTPDQIENPDEIVIDGIALRTSPQTAAQDIPAHWQRFMQEGLANRPGRRDDGGAAYAVYLDYESDYRGAYTLVIGVPVDPKAETPAQMRRVRIPKGRYARFLAQGDPSQALWQTWAYINERWERRSERSYAVDFERYAPDSFAGGAIRAEVIVGLAQV